MFGFVTKNIFLGDGILCVKILKSDKDYINSLNIMQTLRFATFLAPNMFPVYRYIAEYVGKALNLPTQLVTGSSFDQFRSGEVDAGFLCGLPYVHLTRRSPPPVELLAAPVLQGTRYHGKPVYFSDVIVRSESLFRSFMDLRGCSWAYNDPDSQSGYGITCYWLAQLGERPGFFGRVIQAGFHQKSIQMVAAGQVDASAIDSQVLAIELRDRPELSGRIRVIDSLGPSSIQPIVAAARLPESLKADLRSVLLSLGDDPQSRKPLALGFVERLAPVHDSTYDDIRMMLETAQAAGFTTLQ